MKKTKKSAPKNVVGPKIRELRLKAGNISQDDLSGRLAAKGVQLDRTAISRVENQDRYLM